MDECLPVIVEGDWGQTQTRTLRNKLHLYFQSKRKSSGGDCRVEAEDGAPRAAVFFRSEEVRERVLARDDHEIILENKTIKLRLTSGDSPTINNNVSDSSTDSKETEVEPGNDASAANEDDSKSSPGATVVLGNINNTSKDLLSMLVENISGLDESCWRLEIIWESNKAVVTFNNAADAEKFLSVSQTSKKLQKHELSAQPLDAAKSVRVEHLPPTVLKEMLELYFDKTWTEPDSIVMIPEEQAAIVTFSDPKVVESICIKEDYDMRSIPIKVYPYYESLGTALYGSERPTWKMPEPFTESVHLIIWKFLQEKKLFKSINDQMRPHFCRVDLENPQVKLSPMPSFLRQQGLTAKDVDNWERNIQDAFRHLMSQYSAFECPVNPLVWKAAEKDVRSVVMEDVVLVVDVSKGVLTVAGQADDIKRIRTPVENIVVKATIHIDRQTSSISEDMVLSPAWFYILKQDGLQKVALDVSPDMTLSYDEGQQKLTIAGLPTEVFKMKAWILERNVKMALDAAKSVREERLPPTVVKDAEKFLSVSQTSKKLQKHELSAQPLDAAKSVRVEHLPPTVLKEMLELYFDKTWTEPDSIVMIPEEQAAIVTFSDPKVVESICIKEDYDMRSIPIKVYPYYESLGTALYGSERPTWKMPEPFTESVHLIIWKFLQEKKLFKSINDQMRPHFCRVDLENPQVKLSPMPSFLRQQGLTAKDVDNWARNTQDAFRHLMSQYSAFECPVNPPAWKAAEKHVRSVVMEDVVLVVDVSKGVLTVAGQADDIKRIRAPVENIVVKATIHIDRQMKSISGDVVLSPAWLYILKQDGLQKVALDVSPDMTLSYDEGQQKLTIAGLPTEVFKMKAWILERNVSMSKRHLNIPPSLLNFLRSVDPMDMSHDLFTSQGISAVYGVDSKGLFLLGSSDKIFADAEFKMKAVLSTQNLDVEDQEVLELRDWVALNQKLLDTYNSSKKKTFEVHIHPARRDKVTVAGFMNPVKEVSRCLREFIMNYSNVQEKLCVESCAVVQFLDKKKTHDWSSISKANGVKVLFDPEKPRVFITGARLHVQRAKSDFQRLVSTLFTDTLTVDKPGAKKYFQSQGSMFLSTIMSELSCAVTLHQEFEDKEEEEENYGEENSICYSRVQTYSLLNGYKRCRGRGQSQSPLVRQFAGRGGWAGIRERGGRGGSERSLLEAASQSLQSVVHFKDGITSLFSELMEEQPSAEALVLESEEFEHTVFHLCADNNQAVTLAKKKINELIVAEQAKRTIKDMYINHLSQADIAELKTLQRELTVSIRLDRGLEKQEPQIHLEGLTRDVFTAESTVRDIIRRVERKENLKNKALLVSSLVEWQFQDPRTGKMESFDIYTNLKLEEALEKKQSLKIKLNNDTYTADPKLKSAFASKGKQLELLRKDLKDDDALPSHWDDMKGDIVKLFPVTLGSNEYNDVEAQLKKTGLAANIISIERVQNTTLWGGYQLMKKQMEVKNKHTNNERLLFHGTSSRTIDLINKQGFNRSYAGAHGVVYGNGSYFAVDPVYSAQGYATSDTYGHKRIYQARVLVGDFTQGKRGLIAPPPKSLTNAADLYDSVCDHAIYPTMFVIFNDIQAYPEYLITFT